MSTARSQNPSVKVLIALGGWTDSESDKYSRLVSSQANIDKFVGKAKSFVKNHDFDGLSLEWQYPVCWQANCAKGPPSDRQGFTNLVKVSWQSFFDILLLPVR